MATARTVTQQIQRSLRILGVQGAGETPDSNDLVTGLAVMQDMIAYWSEMGWLVPSYTTESKALTVGKVSYSIGKDTSPDWDTIRPVEIKSAFMRDSSNQDYPVNIIKESAYNKIFGKSDNSARPYLLWYNPSTPNGTIYLYPASSNTDSLYISHFQPISEPTGYDEELEADLGIPRSYHNAIALNLAIELADEYGVDPSQILIYRADSLLRSIVATNAAAVGVQGIELQIPSESKGDNYINEGF